MNADQRLLREDIRRNGVDNRKRRPKDKKIRPVEKLTGWGLIIALLIGLAISIVAISLASAAKYRSHIGGKVANNVTVHGTTFDETGSHGDGIVPALTQITDNIGRNITSTELEYGSGIYIMSGSIGNRVLPAMKREFVGQTYVFLNNLGVSISLVASAGDAWLDGGANRSTTVTWPTNEALVVSAALAGYGTNAKPRWTVVAGTATFS